LLEYTGLADRNSIFYLFWVKRVNTNAKGVKMTMI
jgi:hypothetical protein